MKKRKGSTLIFVVAVFMVFFIIGMSLTVLTMQNIRQSVIQKQRMETYYLMLSGIEIAQYAVLEQDDDETEADKMILPDFKEIDYYNDQEIWFCNDTPVVKKIADNYASETVHASHENCRHVTLILSVTDADGGPLDPLAYTQDDIYLNIFSQAEWTPKGGATTRHAGNMRMWTVNPARQFREIVDFM